jgi:hypothetical protein
MSDKHCQCGYWLSCEEGHTSAPPAPGMDFWWDKFLEQDEELCGADLDPITPKTACMFAEWFAQQCAEAEKQYFPQPAPAPAAPPYDPEGVNESIRQQLRDQAAAPEGADIDERLREIAVRACGPQGEYYCFTNLMVAVRHAYSLGESFCTAHTQVYKRVQVLEEMLARKQSALERILWNFKLMLANKPVKEASEAIAEAGAALTEDSNGG